MKHLYCLITYKQKLIFNFVVQAFTPFSHTQLQTGDIKSVTITRDRWKPEVSIPLRHPVKTGPRISMFTPVLDTQQSFKLFHNSFIAFLQYR